MFFAGEGEADQCQPRTLGIQLPVTVVVQAEGEGIAGESLAHADWSGELHFIIHGGQTLGVQFVDQRLRHQEGCAEALNDGQGNVLEDHSGHQNSPFTWRDDEG
ncbi:hypothetical protein DVJ83_17850 (plasmid) [Deinococcus wulumuqiensis]|uniref:Uncharacterized protein n=1 Tax=Deinococcus wulumuqiensis TaxID=980427 RepID=A0A345IMP0_9DEIO|nr:hypothetical protein DVJ83_17850 [Deinococcus wulumuqiensis]